MWIKRAEYIDLVETNGRVHQMRLDSIDNASRLHSYMKMNSELQSQINKLVEQNNELRRENTDLKRRITTEPYYQSIKEAQISKLSFEVDLANLKAIVKESK